jgi:hypothetical protein
LAIKGAFEPLKGIQPAAVHFHLGRDPQHPRIRTYLVRVAFRCLIEVLPMVEIS